MKPPAFDSTPSRSSDEFEQVSYPQEPQDWAPTSKQEPGLPLHYMNLHEDTARRRVVRGPGGDEDYSPGQTNGTSIEYDDEGKDVYTKMKPQMDRLGSGRIRQPPPPPPTTIREYFQQNLEHLPPALYTLASCWTRFHRIGHSSIVVWDEAHFGKFGSHYLKREFYFDVHPPLGKMLVGLAGLLSGYDGQFEFKSGESYGDAVPYVSMRVMMATFGVLMVPLGWYTAVELGMSHWACHIVALMVLFDVGWLCISRFILLDSMLLFFTFTTVFFMTKFHNQQYQSFSFEWWSWLTLTGLSIGCVSSVKLVGLFVTALVGLYTAEDLWDKFGDLKMSWYTQAKHWAARVLCLIVVPILVYMACFKIHFMILSNSGPGDSQMSSLFQANLIGNDFSQNPLDIVYGSKLTLKNMGFGGGLLHSHVQTYPEGSGQQQITCYHYKDENNNWLIMPRREIAPYDPEGPIELLKDGDVIRLVHESTTRNLHSHVVPAPVSKLNHEVSCYGNETVGDGNDYWQVEVVDDLNQGRKAQVSRIQSLTTRLRFKHFILGCYLRADNTNLPQWGFKQLEVSCQPEVSKKDEFTYWNVESHWNDRLEPGRMGQYKTSFLRDFWHLNVAMMTSNNALIPDPDKDDVLASKPSDWVWLNVGLRMCGWGDTQTKYYLTGTPIIWWGGAFSLLLSLCTSGIYVFRQQRKYTDMTPNEWDHFLYVGKVAFFGWCFHYVPFMIMDRVTYIHHYLPTLYFAVLMAGHMLDHFIFASSKFAQKTKWRIFGGIVFLIFANFMWFRDVAFGIDGPITEFTGMMWRSNWNIYG